MSRSCLSPDQSPARPVPHTRVITRLPGCSSAVIGGLGQGDGWTLTIVRTQRGVDWMEAALEAGIIEARPAEEDPAAVNLMNKLALQSRKRWPGERLGMTDEQRAPGVAVLPPLLPVPAVPPKTAIA
jgi:hypothetical protein